MEGILNIMRNKNLILEIKEKLIKLLEKAPSEEKLDDNNLIEFYANVQNLKESIDILNIDSNNNNTRDPKYGLYPDEVMELMNYIQENNSWEHIHTDGREITKYYTMRVDTRTGTVWSITFDNLAYSKTNKSFRTESNYDLKDEIYKFLNENRRDKND